jgi:hypothetical protein
MKPTAALGMRGSTYIRSDRLGDDDDDDDEVGQFRGIHPLSLLLVLGARSLAVVACIC